MRRFVVCGLAALLAAPTVYVPRAQAQGTISPLCPAGNLTQTASQDACQKAVDLFQYLAPQLGTIIAGGNATLGRGSSLGGLPHFSITVRGNIMNGSIPQIDQLTPSVTGAHSDEYPTKSQIIGLPQADLAVGLFKGIPLGLTTVGGLDLIVSAAYLPSVTSGSVKVDVPNGSLKLGFGGRLGLLSESLLTPGVAVTYLRRDLPTVNIGGTTNNGDSLAVDGLEVHTNAWRVVANKSLLLFGLAVGAGQDKYSSKGNIRAYVAPRTGLVTGVSAGPVALKQDLTRTNIFADLSLNLPLLKIVGEIGHVSGGTINTYNTFEDGAADDARTYGSVGLRFGI
jgi:hypothetical protein